MAPPMKAKGVGESGTCGVPAAVANAIYNATGCACASTSTTLDKMIAKLPPQMAQRCQRRRAALRPLASAAANSLALITQAGLSTRRSTARSIKARARAGCELRLP